MPIIKVSIARRRTVISMAKQSADHRQGFLVHRCMTGEGMAEIVNTQLAERCPIDDLEPGMPNALYRTMTLVVPEQPWIPGLTRQVVDDFARRRTKPDGSRAGFAVAQVEAAPLHVVPLEGQNYLIAAPGQQQEHEGRTGAAHRWVIAGSQQRKFMAKPG